MSPGYAVIIAGSALIGALIVIGLPVILGIRYALRERELEHIERMKALEVGQTLPRDEPWWSPQRLCVAIGAGVPVGIFLIALIASQSGWQHDAFVWPAAGSVGMAAVICGTILAAKLPRALARTYEANSRAASKAALDPDTYDVVSRRG
ncbi:MAG TPA: hypothetical protein VGZ22_14215 [Isosphaeraceae bacterium]|jgi:hypothetical protein|nr:hypothetical protein [Isosphaeraceae bacterium]